MFSLEIEFDRNIFDGCIQDGYIPLEKNEFPGATEKSVTKKRHPTWTLYI